MKKLVTGVCLAAVVIAAVFVALSVRNSVGEGEDKPAADTEDRGLKASEQVMEPGLPSSIPADGDEANRLIALNQLIFEVAQQNAALPEDQRMTPEEIRELVRSRVRELQGQL